MLSFPVVKHLNVFEAHVSDLLSRLESFSKDAFVFETVEPTFRRCIVPAVPFSTHRTSHSIFRQQRLKGMTRILTSPIRVMHQTHRWAATKPRHGQCIGHYVSCHAGLQRPANDLAVKQVKNDSQVQPAFIRPQVRDVGRPDLIRCTGLKVSIQQVLRHRQTVLRIRRGFIAALVPCPHIVLSHQSLHPRFTGREPPVSQFPQHAWAAIGALELGMDRLDQCQHLHIRQPLAARRTTTLPAAIAADADRQDATHFCQTVLLTMPINPGVLHSASFAKYAAAFFMISFSRLSLTFSARNRESSICSSETGLVEEPLSAPRAAALDQLRNVCSLIPSSLATAENDCPSLTRLTANSLNSRVYDWRGIFMANLPLSDVNNMSPLWKTKYQGKLKTTSLQKK